MKFITHTWLNNMATPLNLDNPIHECGIKLYHRIPISKRFKLRKEILNVQGGNCYWCKKPLSIWWQKVQSTTGNRRRRRRSNAELDHIIPRCAGGENVRENLCCSCTECNRQRSFFYMAGVGKLDIIGQQKQKELLDLYKRRYSSNHKTKKFYRERILNANTNSSG